jgi:hypothetical protein
VRANFGSWSRYSMGNGKVPLSSMTLSALITLETDHISEKQLAQIALAIQNRWEAPAFVKMHEIVIMDEDGELGHIPTEDFQRGISTIFENLELSRAFIMKNKGKRKYYIEKIEGATLPSWMEEIEQAPRVPEGVHECPHCGVRFGTDLELSMHTKLHYLF